MYAPGKGEADAPSSVAAVRCVKWWNAAEAEPDEEGATGTGMCWWVDNQVCLDRKPDCQSQ